MTKILLLAAALSSSLAWLALHGHDHPVVEVDSQPVEEASGPGLIGLEAVFRAIMLAETGGHPDPTNAVGDGGRSLGPMQIQEPYFLDAVEHDSSLAGLEYEQVKDVEVAERVMRAYWHRYATGLPWSAEELCRLHNGGPSKRGTDQYWAKCRGYLDGR